MEGRDRRKEERRRDRRTKVKFENVRTCDAVSAPSSAGRVCRRTHSRPRAEGVCVTRHPYHCRRRDSAHPDPPTLSSEAYLSPSTTTLPSLCPILAQASTSTLPRHHEHPLPKSLWQGMRKRDARGPRKPPCPSPVYHDERACNL